MSLKHLPLVAIALCLVSAFSFSTAETTGIQQISFFGRTFVLDDFVTYQPTYCVIPTNSSAASSLLLSNSSSTSNYLNVSRSNDLPFGVEGAHPFNNRKIRDLKRCTELSTFYSPNVLAIPPLFRSDAWDRVAPAGSCFQTLEHRLYASPSTFFAKNPNGTINFRTSPSFSCDTLAQEIVRGFWCAAVGAQNATGYQEQLRQVGFFDTVSYGLMDSSFFNCAPSSGAVADTVAVAADIIQTSPKKIQVRAKCGDGSVPPRLEFCNRTYSNFSGSLFKKRIAVSGSETVHCPDGALIDCDVCFPYLAPDLLAQPYFLFVFPALKFVVVKFIQLFLVARLAVYFRKNIENKLNDNVISFEDADAWADRLQFVDYLIQTLLGGGRHRIRSRVSLIAPESRDALQKAYSWFQDPTKHTILQNEAAEILSEKAIHLQSCMLSKYEVMKMCYDITAQLKKEKNVDDDAILGDIEEWFFSQVCLGGQRMVPETMENKNLLRRCISEQLDVRLRRQVKFFVPEVDLVWDETNSTPRNLLVAAANAAASGNNNSSNKLKNEGGGAEPAKTPSSADLEVNAEELLSAPSVNKVEQKWAKKAKAVSVARRALNKKEAEDEKQTKKKMTEVHNEDANEKDKKSSDRGSEQIQQDRTSQKSLPGGPSSNMSSVNNNKSKNNAAVPVTTTPAPLASNKTKSSKSFSQHLPSKSTSGGNQPQQRPGAGGTAKEDEDEEYEEYEEYEEEVEEDEEEEQQKPSKRQQNAPVKKEDSDGFDLVGDDDIVDANDIRALRANRLPVSRTRKFFRKLGKAIEGAAVTLRDAADDIATDTVQAVQDGKQIARDAAETYQMAAKSVGQHAVEGLKKVVETAEVGFDHIKEELFSEEAANEYQDPEDVDPWEAEDTIPRAKRQLKMPAISTHLGNAITCSAHLNSRREDEKAKQQTRRQNKAASNTNVNDNNNNNNINNESSSSPAVSPNAASPPTTSQQQSPFTSNLRATISNTFSTKPDSQKQLLQRNNQQVDNNNNNNNNNNSNKRNSRNEDDEDEYDGFDDTDNGAELEYVADIPWNPDLEDDNDDDDEMDDTASQFSNASTASLSPRTAELKKEEALLKKRADQYLYRVPKLRSDKVTLMFRSALMTDSLQIGDDDEDDDDDDDDDHGDDVYDDGVGAAHRGAGEDGGDGRDDVGNNIVSVLDHGDIKVTTRRGAGSGTKSAASARQDSSSSVFSASTHKDDRDTSVSMEYVLECTESTRVIRVMAALWQAYSAYKKEREKKREELDRNRKEQCKACAPTAACAVVVAPPSLAVIEEHLAKLDVSKSRLVVLFDYAGTRFQIVNSNTVKDLFQHTNHFSLETRTSASFKCNITGREANDSQKKLGKSFMRLVQMRFLAVDDPAQLHQIEMLGPLVMKPFISSEFTVNRLRNRFVEEAIIEDAKYPIASLRLDTVEFVSRLLNTSLHSRILEATLWAIGEETFFESDLTTNTRYRDRNFIIQKQRKERAEQESAFGGSLSRSDNGNDKVSSEAFGNSSSEDPSAAELAQHAHYGQQQQQQQQDPSSKNFHRLDARKRRHGALETRFDRAHKIFCDVTQSFPEFQQLIHAVNDEERRLEDKRRCDELAEEEFLNERRRETRHSGSGPSSPLGDIDPVPSFCALFESLTVYEDRGRDRVGVLVTTDKDRAAYHFILEQMYYEVEQSLQRERSPQLTLSALQALVAQHRQGVEQVTSLIKVVKLEAQVRDTVFSINMYVVGLSVLYGLAFLIMCGQEAAASGEDFFELSGPARWLRYEHIYSRFLNSGTPASLIAASVVNFFTNKQARDESRYYRMFDYLLLTSAALLVAPAMITHLIPGGILYIWIVLMVLIIFSVPTAGIFMLWNILVDRAHKMIAKNASKGKDNLSIPKKGERPEDVIAREKEEGQRLSSLASLKAAMTGICVWVYLVVLILLTAATQTLFNWAFLMYHQSDFDLDYKTIPTFEFSTRRTQCYAVGVFANAANVMQFVSSFAG